jgi:excinuclease UvrABC nuclease subunit
VHRAPWLRGKPGVYAFVVDGEVRYIGKAGRLHRRLRRYSNRSFGKPGGTELRRCHREIIATIDHREVVRVFALVVDDQSVSLLELERRYICRFSPLWNQ